jgi:hypothetical protein
MAERCHGLFLYKNIFCGKALKIRPKSTRELPIYPWGAKMGKLVFPTKNKWKKERGKE